MKESDRASLLAKMESGRAAMAESLAGIGDADAAAQPGEGRWSALGNVEHVAAVETRLLQGIEQAAPVDGESKPGREEMLFVRVQNREQKLSAPPPTLPAGECNTVAAAMQKFDAARERTVAFVKSCDHDLRLRATTHPLLGPMTAMECIHLIAGHPFRHAAQIRELRGLFKRGDAGNAEKTRQE